MKRFTAVFLVLTSLFFTLIGCAERPDTGSTEAQSESESETESETRYFDPEHPDAFYNPDTADYYLTLFTVDVPEKPTDSKNYRVLIMSDMHYCDFYNGAGGYTSEERFEKMTEFLIRSSYDCVIFNGDMTSRDEEINRMKNPDYVPNEKNYLEHIKAEYFDELTRRGIPNFAINASHDSCVEGEFEEIFGYSNNYVVLVGTTAYICIDTYAGERLASGQTAMSDIPLFFLNEVKKLLAHDYVEDAFVVCHYPANDLKNVVALIGQAKVRGTVVGHSHYNPVVNFAGKPMLQCGHFSRADVKQTTNGLEFKAFTPVAWNSDYSKTGSPWQVRAFEYTEGKDGARDMIESYMIFPEETYLDCKIEGRSFVGFHQPYAEARPSFLGEDAPIDRSYYKLMLS